MTFLADWQSKLPPAYAEFARLATATPELEAGPGLIAVAILWPIHAAIQEFDGEALDAVRDICGVEAKQVFKAVQGWTNDPVAAARNLTSQAKNNSALTEALNQLNQHFQAAGPFAEALAQAIVKKQGRGDVYHIAGQVKAALINMGGTTNIQSLTIQLNLAHAAPPKPVIPPLPYEPETILIPAGPFVMGSDDGDPHEAPSHTVTLPDYYIGKYPVTHTQYFEFINQTGTTVSSKTGWVLAKVGKRPPAAKLNHPMVGVNWDEAVAYCRWLSQQTGRIYRLPTEAEWEKAARGSAEARRYPWGNDWQPQRCNYQGAETTPVDQFGPQSSHGCYDLVGNVWQWTATMWGYDRAEPDFIYPYQPDHRNDPPAQVRYREYRIGRGGSNQDAPHRLRCSARARFAANNQYPQGGFRVLREI